MSALPQVHAKLISLVELLDKPKKDVSKLVSALQALCEVLIHDFSKELRTMEKFREEGLASQRLEGNIVLPFENIVEVPDDDNISFYRQVRRLQTILTSAR
ncbi:hypothetical protein MKW94_019747 [Papaver nudicaule]|uniref:Callose synthase helical domain-containing protein n=1 Tax=Papaver nudicaule TaxID=74823 RepID=A0AA42ATT1_PAPNU|nr:hypothetical protein [Papaver nudicaule]